MTYLKIHTTRSVKQQTS